MHNAEPSRFDRRTAPRISSRVSVELGLAGLHGPLPGSSLDIGPSGVCVRTESRFALSAVDTISLELGRHRVIAAAEGRWQRLDNCGNGFLSGLMFREPSDSTRGRIREHMFARVQELAAFLIESSELRGLPIDDAVDAALLTRAADYPTGRHVYTQGEARSRGDSIFIVELGAVVLEARVARVGRVVIDRVEAGGVFAGLPLLAGAEHSESAIADCPVRMIEIDPFSFWALQETRPNVASALSLAIMRRRASGQRNLLERSVSAAR